MTKVSEIANVAAEIVRETDALYLIRALGTSPETYESYRLPASALDKGTIYDFGFDFPGTPDGAVALGRAIVAADIRIDAAMARCFGLVTAPPDADFVIEMQIETSESPALETVATITIGMDGSFTFAPVSSPAAPVDIDAGTRVWFNYFAGGVSPAMPDPSILDITAVIGARVR